MRRALLLVVAALAQAVGDLAGRLAKAATEKVLS